MDGGPFGRLQTVACAVRTNQLSPHTTPMDGHVVTFGMWCGGFKVTRHMWPKFRPPQNRGLLWSPTELGSSRSRSVPPHLCEHGLNRLGKQRTATQPGRVANRPALGMSAGGKGEEVDRRDRSCCDRLMVDFPTHTSCFHLILWKFVQVKSSDVVSISHHLFQV